MQYRTRLLDSKKTIANKINNALLKQVETKVATFSAQIKEELPDVLIKAIKKTDVYNSLTSGGGIGTDLRAEFGFSSSSHTPNDIDEIIEAIVGQIYVSSRNIRAGSNGIAGRISIEAIHKDLEDALGLSQASFESKGDIFPWLDWLSFEGDKIIISDYSIIYGNFNPTYSRSGKAIMRKSKGFWKVPPVYAGTRDNNWITKAVEQGNSEIRNTISQLLGNII